VWSDGPTNAWAVGQQSTIARWDGTRWNAVSDVRRPIVAQLDNYNAVWGAGGSVWIAGDAGIIRCRTATTCSQEQVPGAGVLYAIWGTSATNAFAVGAGGRILHFDGTAWTAMTSPTTGRLVRLWGNGPNNVWAAGDTVVLRYNGTAWKPATPEELQPSQNAFDSSAQGLKQIGVWGTTSGDLYLSTWFSRILRYDGLMWSEIPAPFQEGIGIARIVAVAGAVNGCPLAITDGQSAIGGPTLLRGVGPTGCNATPLTGPASWP
jgi:hypothetical protein